MPIRVLVAMDGSEIAKGALEYALDVHADADITVLHVVGQPTAMMGEAVSLAFEDDIETAAEDLAADVFDEARDIAAAHDAEISTEVGWGTPAKEIVSEAEEYDTVVIGSHSGSLADRLFVGNVAEKVFRHSPTPVTVVR